MGSEHACVRTVLPNPARGRALLLKMRRKLWKRRVSMNQPSPHKPPHVLIIGIGNEFRHDDAVGLVVARALQDQVGPQVTVLESSGEWANLIELWAKAERVILIDAVVSGAAPGTIHDVDISEQSLPTGLLTQSSHAFGVAQAVEMARTLNRLPPMVHFIGIEGQDFSTGLGLSQEIERVVDDGVRAVLTLLEDWT